MRMSSLRIAWLEPSNTQSGSASHDGALYREVRREGLVGVPMLVSRQHAAHNKRTGAVQHDPTRRDSSLHWRAMRYASTLPASLARGHACAMTVVVKFERKAKDLERYNIVPKHPYHPSNILPSSLLANTIS